MHAGSWVRHTGLVALVLPHRNPLFQPDAELLIVLLGARSWQQRLSIRITALAYRS